MAAVVVSSGLVASSRLVISSGLVISSRLVIFSRLVASSGLVVGFRGFRCLLAVTAWICYDAMMRTTIDLPDDIHALARELAHQQRKTLSQVITELVRTGLGTRNSKRRRHPRGARASVDPARPQDHH